MEDLSPNDLRKVFGQYPTGVTVVTTMDSNGEPIGMTANSFASVSLSPPLILWSIDRGGEIHDIFTQATHFCVHMLAEHQEEVSTRFSSGEKKRFSGIIWSSGELGSPLLSDYLCRIECSLENVFDGGDHSVMLGRVAKVEFKEEHQKPLVFHQGTYKRL